MRSRATLALALVSFAACSDRVNPDGGYDGGPDARVSDAARDVTPVDVFVTDGSAPDESAPDVLGIDESAPDVIVVDEGPDAPPPPPVGLDARPANPNCRAWARPAGAAQLRRVFPRLSFNLPVVLRQAPGDRSRFFVVEKRGSIRVFSNLADPAEAGTFIDITARVNSAPNEAGLLGLAFHPRFATNGQAFLSYTATVGGRLTSRLSRFTSRDMGRTLDPASEQVLLETTQPYENHNGGAIEFGPDGFLYYALGDGGAGGDPMGAGQRLNTVLGKILRVDVNGAAPYGIPADNPFRAGAMGARPEIYAYGLRNPWKFSFDRMTGRLWAGDVGQNAYEEVDIIERGGNYGWNTMEGLHCYPSGESCNRMGLTLPVHEYPRSDGVSITGGYVYRGRALPSLQGQYIFGDFGTGNVWALRETAPGTWTRSTIAMGQGQISSFGEDEDGEVYMLRYDSGQVMQLQPGTAVMDPTPTTLSATRCVDMANPSRPAPGLIPYAVNAPLWSDGANKERFLAVPDGQRITVGADGDWDLPVGSVVVKSFLVGDRRVETRLMVRHEDGDWAGYTYAWNDAGTEATLLRDGGTRTVGGVTWTIPSQSQCLQCHTTAAGRTLGLETAQLNGDLAYAQTGRTANQLATLDAIGLFASRMGSPASQPALPTYTGSASPELRARAYLHANCSNCHRPGSTGRGSADLRFGTPFAMSGLCNATPENDLGVMGARLLAPMRPDRSVLALRMMSTGAERMPPLASRVVDREGAGLVQGWITALASCP